MFDLTEIIKRIIKYLVMGFMIALVSYSIPKQSLKLEEIALISLCAAASFCILDTYLPSFAVASRLGAGFTMGSNIVGGFM